VFNNISETRNYSYHFEDPGSIIQLEHSILSFLSIHNPDYLREVVYLCIGTDRATGDCLGPLVGTRLQMLSRQINLLGTLESPVHAVNLHDQLNKLAENYYNPCIVAIDACLGNVDRIGFINVKEGGLKPGTALKKTLPEVGDFHISGVVNVGGFLEHLVLQNTRLHTVYKMAETISKGIYLAQHKINLQKLSVTNLIQKPPRVLFE
jgi:putative sporulation protein YyaC